MMICLQKIYGGTKHGLVDMGGDVNVLQDNRTNNSNKYR